MSESKVWAGPAMTQDRVGIGIVSMLLAVAALAVMDAMAKWLAEGYPIAELVFFRNLFALLPILFIVWQGGGLAALIWGTLIGWLVWHELPGAHVWLGAGVVVASGLYIIHREAQARR